MKEFLWIWVAILGTISRRKNREGELTQSWAWRSVGGKLRRVSFGGGAGQEYRRNHQPKGSFPRRAASTVLGAPVNNSPFTSSLPTPFSSGSSRPHHPITLLSRLVNGASNVHRVISQISLAIYDIGLFESNFIFFTPSVASLSSQLHSEPRGERECGVSLMDRSIVIEGINCKANWKLENCLFKYSIRIEQFEV